MEVVMKRSLSFILVVLIMSALFVGLAGCQSSADPIAESVGPAQSAETTSENTENASEPEEPENVPVTIVVWGAPNADTRDYETNTWNEQIALFKERYPWITVEEVALKPGTDYREQYDKALLAGIEPTVCRILPYVDIPSRALKGEVAEITTLVENWDLYKEGDVFTGFNDAIQMGGKWYAIPYAVQINGIMCNKQLLEEKGFDPNNLPKTWEEFAKIGQEISSEDKETFGYSMVGMSWNAWPFTLWVYSAGGEMVRPNGDGTYEIAFNETPGVDAAEFWNKMVHEYKMTQKDVLQDWPDVLRNIAAGRAAFGFGQPGWVTQSAQEEFGIDPSVFVMMAQPGKTEDLQSALAGGEVFTFSPRATEEELKAAFLWATFMGYDEEALKIKWKNYTEANTLEMTAEVRLSMMDKKLEMSGWSDEIKQTLIELAKGAKGEPAPKNWNELKDALAPVLQEILLEKNMSRDIIQTKLDMVAEEMYALYPDSYVKP